MQSGTHIAKPALGAKAAASSRSSSLGQGMYLIDHGQEGCIYMICRNNYTFKDLRSRIYDSCGPKSRDTLLTHMAVRYFDLWSRSSFDAVHCASVLLRSIWGKLSTSTPTSRRVSSQRGYVRSQVG